MKECMNCHSLCEDDEVICSHCGKFINKIENNIEDSELEKANYKVNIIIAIIICICLFLVSLLTVIMASTSQSLTYVCMLGGIVGLVFSIALLIGCFVAVTNKNKVTDNLAIITGLAAFILLFIGIDFIVCINHLLFGI